MIQPTIGRIVWFWPESEDELQYYQKQPNAAIIACVNDDGTINLGVFDVFGENFGAIGVTLIQAEDERPEKGTEFAEWMPYQIGQAKANKAK